MATARTALNANTLVDEASALARALETVAVTADEQARMQSLARAMAQEARDAAADQGLIPAFMREYTLSSREGILLMRLAEALLRTPDAATVDALIADKLDQGAWTTHAGKSKSTLVNLSTMGLSLAEELFDADEQSAFSRMVGRLGKPVARQAIWQAMRRLGDHFVLGQNIGAALKASDPGPKGRILYSYEMLGEGALTAEDADRYFKAYADAIDAVGKTAKHADVRLNPGISVKLSALHPRYDAQNRSRILDELAPRVLALAERAASLNMGMNIDAEESERLDLSLDVIEAVARSKSLGDWPGFGIVVQAYQRRALDVLDWLDALAQETGRPLMVRLVKGAYWDTEVKRAQEFGMASFPVFTRKVSTDVNYLACVRRLFAAEGRIYPQLATHNAHTVAGVLTIAGNRRDFEFQKLFGMGDELYEAATDRADVPVRVYAPVGSHRDLLPYLVRRLLENGANSSFVNQLDDPRVPIDDVVRDPFIAARGFDPAHNPQVTAPMDLFGPDRPNAVGVDVLDPVALMALDAEVAPHRDTRPTAAPLIDGQAVTGDGEPVLSPQDRSRVAGHVIWARAEDLGRAVDSVTAGAAAWAATPAVDRAHILRAVGDALETDMPRLIALCQVEAGKTLADGVAEVREAVDFCRYYALRLEQDAALLRYLDDCPAEGRVFACISPWNFPIAIFTGQVIAALSVGCGVIAKPAEQTSLCAMATIELMLKAGVPADALALLPGDGQTIGAPLVGHAGVHGVAFTGSTPVAKAIQRTLAGRGALSAPLIAETGGLNAMIVDTTALAEQAVKDVVRSAFQSAGQRCSAARLLFVPKQSAKAIEEMLAGAMAQLRVGDPIDPRTDVGPVIDAEAKDRIAAHLRQHRVAGRVVAEARLASRPDGHWVAPSLIRLDSTDQLTEEIFGPVLHMVTYDSRRLPQLVDAINAAGYGLTLGLHSRIDDRAELVADRAHVGNIYVNRNQIGAVVGSQPFGGEGLSGTGPKAGGPNYQWQFAAARAPSAAPDAAALPPAERMPEPVPMLPPQADAFIQAISRHNASLGQVAAGVAAAWRTAGAEEQLLPGPTGESNVLRLKPRGRLLVHLDAETATDRALAVLTAAFVTGNAVIASGGSEIWETLRSALGGLVPPPLGGAEALAVAEHGAIDGIAVACSGSMAAAFQTALAQRAGAILPLIRADAYASHPLMSGPLYRYCREQTVTINTAAAGGNAELMAELSA